MAEWANFLLALIIAIIGGSSALIAWFVNGLYQKIEAVEKLVKHLEVEILEECQSLDRDLIKEIKYDRKDIIDDLKNEIKNIHHLIDNIEIRLNDRTKYARAKWANLNKIINNILKYLEKKGYVIRDLPISGVGGTMSADDFDDDDLPDTNIF